MICSSLLTIRWQDRNVDCETITPSSPTSREKRLQPSGSDAITPNHNSPHSHHFEFSHTGSQQMLASSFTADAIKSASKPMPPTLSKASSGTFCCKTALQSTNITALQQIFQSIAAYKLPLDKCRDIVITLSFARNSEYYVKPTGFDMGDSNAKCVVVIIVLSKAPDWTIVIISAD